MNKSELRYWTAFYTKPRNERKVSERLQIKGFEVYCPVKTVLRQWSDRKKKVKEPLFTSYIFAKINESQRQDILKDPSIVSSVFWLKEPVRIREREIEAIKKFLEENPDPKVLNSTFKEGQKVEVFEGPLKGEKGECLKMKGSRLILTIESLNMSLVAEVAASKVRLAS